MLKSPHPVLPSLRAPGRPSQHPSVSAWPGLSPGTSPTLPTPSPLSLPRALRVQPPPAAVKANRRRSWARQQKLQTKGLKPLSFLLLGNQCPEDLELGDACRDRADEREVGARLSVTGGLCAFAEIASLP